MKKLLIAALLGLSCLGAWPLAHALQITLVPRGGYQIAPGGSVLVDLGIAGLQSGGLDTELGAFHLDLYYDPTVLAYHPSAPSAWGGALGQAGSESLAFADNGTPGLLRLDQVSLLDGLTLDQLQGDAFRLATLAFDVLPWTGPTPANTFLFADDILLGDAAGNVIPAALDGIPVLILQVDEPGTLAIIGLGLGLAALSARSRPGGAVGRATARAWRRRAGA
nr:hypothetical protein [uncultured Duganella sp.]